VILWLDENEDGYITGYTSFLSPESRRIKYDGVVPENLRDDYGRFHVRWTGSEFITETLPISEEERFNADNIKKTILALSLIVEAIVRDEPLPPKAVEYMQKAIRYIKETL